MVFWGLCWKPYFLSASYIKKILQTEIDYRYDKDMKEKMTVITCTFKLMIIYQMNVFISAQWI